MKITVKDLSADEAKEEADMVRFKVVALDLDGTLLGPDHEVSAKAVEYLTYIQNRGIHIVIATGRSASCVFDTIKKLNLDQADFPLVCSNGATGLKVSKCTTRQQVLFEEPVNKDLTKRTLALAQSLGLTVQYYLQNEIHVHTATYGHRHLVRRYSQLTGTRQIEVNNPNYESVMCQGLPLKLLVLCDEDKVDDVTLQLQHELGQEAHVIRGTPPFFVEVLNAQVCKGHGLRRLINSTMPSISPKQVVAFGDGDNDVEFLQWAGHGVAMKNARESLKQVADEVLNWTNAEDGVILKLQEMEQRGQLDFTK